MITAAFEAPTVVAGLDDIAMVGQTVEQRGGHLGIAEHARPFADGSEFARPAYANAMREEIAKHMIEVAGRGERDQRILAEDAVRFLAENYKY